MKKSDLIPTTIKRKERIREEKIDRKKLLAKFKILEFSVVPL